MSSPNIQIIIPVQIIILIASLIALRWTPGRWREGVRILRNVSAAYLVLLLLAYLIPTYSLYVLDRFRPIPEPETRALFQGITYRRDVRASPRPMVIHSVRIELDAPGIQFVVTPADPSGGMDLRARTVSEFLKSEGAQLAINGDFFGPWWDNSLVDYYPLDGQPVSVMGFAASQGHAYSEAEPYQPTISISADNRVSFGEAAEPAFNAISGNPMLVEEGREIAIGNDAYFNELHPRTAVGLSQDGQTLILVVIDGRQPGYSEGATLAELAGILIQAGAWTALNLDGGGSAELAMMGADGIPQALSAPIHNHIPGRERPVANQLGVYARPLGAATQP